MLTYQLQQRRLAIKNGIEPTFPSDVRIEILLEPKEQFGVQSDPPKLSKTIKAKSKTDSFWDANTGKWGGISNPPLNPINTEFNIKDDHFVIKGNKIEIDFKIQSIQEMNNTINSLYFFLPSVMNVVFREPPTIVSITGTIGKTLFRLELISSNGLYDVTTEIIQEKRMLRSLETIYLLNDPSNIRLTAGQYYYYVARRLIEAGISPYEFLSEVILNYSKALQILFGESREEIRVELRKLGVENDDLEELYMPIMILRNELDVGHVSIKSLKRSELDLLYYYLDNLEVNIQKLFQQIINAVKSKSYQLKDISIRTDENKIVDELISNWAKLKKREGTLVN